MTTPFYFISNWENVCCNRAHTSSLVGSALMKNVIITLPHLITQPNNITILPVSVQQVQVNAAQSYGVARNPFERVVSITISHLV